MSYLLYMRTISLFFLLVCFLYLFSCRKEDTVIQVSYPSVYTKSELRITSAFRVFSSQGEINTPSIISRFSESDTSFLSYIANSLLTRQGWIDTIQFSAPPQAKVTYHYYAINCLVSPESGKIILSRTDTSNGFTGGEVLRKTLAFNMGLIKPEVYSEYIYSSTGGNYLFGYTAKEKFVFTEYEKQLSAPVILFKLRKDGVSQYDYTNNILPTNFYKTLQTGDTLSIWECSILYQKR